jgi:D-glycero-D-manno-heptose 1,7-bisphosphate phosphatase
MISLNMDPVKSDGVRGALFLDRDGTLIEHIPYLHDPALVKLRPGVKEGLRLASEAGLLLFLFTNQSGVGRGWFTLGEALACNRMLAHLLSLPEPVFAAECTAPESPEAVPIYRKPSPKFIKEMIARYSLSQANCWMIGDKPVDLKAAENAGISGHQLAENEDFTGLIQGILQTLSAV